MTEKVKDSFSGTDGDGLIDKKTQRQMGKEVGRESRAGAGGKNLRGGSVRDTAERQMCKETKSGAAHGNKRVTEADRREIRAPVRAP